MNERITYDVGTLEEGEGEKRRGKRRQSKKGERGGGRPGPFVSFVALSSSHTYASGLSGREGARIMALLGLKSLQKDCLDLDDSKQQCESKLVETLDNARHMLK